LLLTFSNVGEGCDPLFVADVGKVVVAGYDPEPFEGPTPARETPGMVAGVDAKLPLADLVTGEGEPVSTTMGVPMGITKGGGAAVVLLTLPAGSLICSLATHVIEADFSSGEYTTVGRAGVESGGSEPDI